MLEIGVRVKHREKGWFGKVLAFVDTQKLYSIQIENGGKCTYREEALVPATDEENQARLYQEIVKFFLKAAERRLVQDWKDGNVAVFGDGNPFTLTYTAPFEAGVLKQIAKQLGFDLPKVLLVKSTEF